MLFFSGMGRPTYAFCSGVDVELVILVLRMCSTGDYDTLMMSNVAEDDRSVRKRTATQATSTAYGVISCPSSATATQLASASTFSTVRVRMSVVVLGVRDYSVSYCFWMFSESPSRREENGKL